MSAPGKTADRIHASRHPRTAAQAALDHTAGSYAVSALENRDPTRSRPGRSRVQNAFVEGNIPNGVFRELTEEEMDVYRAPFVEPESRLPILVFPRQISVDGEPADVTERVNAFNTYLLTTDVPKLHLYVTPGLINPPQAVEFLQSQGAPSYEAVFLGQGSHFLQEDHPEAIGRNISDWYRRLDQ